MGISRRHGRKWSSLDAPHSQTYEPPSPAMFTHGDDNRHKLSKCMCHDVRTADKYYVTNLLVKQAVEHRRLFQAALQGEERSPSETELPKKRKRPLRKAPRPCNRVSPDLTDVTSTSTSPEDAEKHLTESAVSTLGSEKDDPASSQTGSGEMEAAEVTREETKGMKKLRVVLTPLGLKARLRPRRISPLNVRKVKALTKSKKVSNKVKKILEKRRRKI
ncbi:uncharacterized protein LOC143726029 [Siphateles boraxobius]|uniref:uncharacterized protein LOC143726029 n=1 Tax=Siphateles boraxobius TaxID=180520 RepID=UPI0040635F38